MERLAILLPSYNPSLDEIKYTFNKLPREIFICVVDDGSDKPFHEVAHEIIKSFTNVKVIRLDNNAGIEVALNTGLEYLLNKFEFIARLDMGDTCQPERFYRQLQYLSENNEYSLVGCWANFLDKHKNKLFEKKMPVEDFDIRRKMFINNMFIHPSVMMRSESIKMVGGYAENYKACEDYDLFFRLLQVGKGRNLPHTWLDYEVNFLSISSLKRNKQVINRIKIIVKNFSFYKFGLYPYYGIIRNSVFILLNRKLTTAIQKISSNPKIK